MTKVAGNQTSLRRRILIRFIVGISKSGEPSYGGLSPAHMICSILAFSHMSAGRGGTDGIGCIVCCCVGLSVSGGGGMGLVVCEAPFGPGLVIGGGYVRFAVI